MESRIEKNSEKIEKIESEERKIRNKKITKIVLWIVVPIFVLFTVSYTLLRFIGNLGIMVREYSVINEKLPNDFNGIKIAQFSDIHYSDYTSLSNIKSIVKVINNTNPDIVIFTGDLIDKNYNLNNTTKEEIIKEFNKIDARIGKYAIKGEEDEKNFEDIFNSSNFTILNNTIEKIYINSSVINLIAVDNTYTYNELTKSDDNYSIAITHEPDLSDRIVSDYSPELILAGHSHNGQVVIPFIGPLMKKEGAKKYISNYYKIKDTDLYISGGLGNSSFNFRLFNHPSINFYRLKSSK